MDIRYFPDAPPPGWPLPIAALGNFDGVHRGHQELIDGVRRRAAERGGTSVVMIFDPHPPQVLRPDKAPPLLMTLEQKLTAFERAGLGGVAIVRFTHELSRWEPETFVERVLIDWLRVAEVWVGENFLFGRDRTGTFTLMRALGEDKGFRTEKIDPVFYKDFVVSSTRIRRLIGEGRVDESAALLGHHYVVEGLVVRGDGRGRQLGIPTANIEPDNALLPAPGVYATRAQVVRGAQVHRVHQVHQVQEGPKPDGPDGPDGPEWFPAVTSVGVRPTIGDGRFTVETFLLDGVHELYGTRLRVAFVKRLREQRKFDDLAGLSAQMVADCDEARKVLSS